MACAQGQEAGSRSVVVGTIDRRPTALGLPAPRPGRGKKIAEKVIASFPSCPIPEIARLGRTLKQWRHAFLA